MEGLGIKPNQSIVDKVGDIFQKVGMMEKYTKLKKKYPPPRWEIRYIKGKRVRIQANKQSNLDGADNMPSEEKETIHSLDEVPDAELNQDKQIFEVDKVDKNLYNLVEEAETSSDKLRIESKNSTWPVRYISGLWYHISKLSFCQYRMRKVLETKEDIQ